MKKILLTLGIVIAFLIGNYDAIGQTLNATAGTLNIGPVIVGQTSADGGYSFTVTGSGFNPNEPIYTDSQDSHFKISLSGGTGTYVLNLTYSADGSGNVSQVIYVNYTPTQAGYLLSSILVYDFQVFGEVYKSVKGIGQGPEILMEGRETSGDSWLEIVSNETTPAVNQGTQFGNALVGIETADRTYQITNTSSGGFSAILVLTEYEASKYVQLIGANADQFSVTAEPTTPIAIGGGTTTFTVHFDPTSAGVKNAQVKIINSDPNENPYIFAIQGTGTITAPDPPTTTAATLVDNNSFEANWTSGGGGPTEGYLLYVATNNTFTTYVSGYNGLDVGLVTTYEVIGLNANTNYYYRLKAYNTGGYSLVSNTITQKTAPPVPTAQPATNIDNDSFYANWNFVSSATSYRLDVNTAPDFTGTVILDNYTVVTNYHFVINLTGGTTYFYRVRSNNGNSSESSETISAVTLCNSPVANAATSIGAVQFTANWTPPTGGAPDFYRLDVSTTNSFTTFVLGYQAKTVIGTSQLVTGLAQNTQYFYRVRALNVSGKSDNSNVIDLYTYSSSATSTWTGAVSSTWYYPGNWDNGIPAPTTNAIIPNVTTQPVVAMNNSCNNLTVNALADLTVNNGVTLTVNGNLLIKSDVSGTGSILEYGGLSVTGTKKVEFYISKARWHYVSSPVSNAKASVYEDIYLKYYNEPISDWTYIIDLLDPLTVGQGYAAWSTDQYLGNTTVTYQGGSLNSGTIASSVTNSGDGWNLVGNPYPSAIGWDNAGWVRTNLDASVYVYDGANYLFWNGSFGTLTNGIIPAYQAYYVKATGSPTLQVSNSARLLGPQAYKSGEVSNLIEVEVAGNGYKDVAYINFNENATTGFDSQFDAYKLFGIDEAPQIYSIVGDEIAAINTLPEYYPGMVIPMGFRAGVDTEYTFNINNLGSFEFPINVYIEDTQTGDFVDMSSEDLYTVTAGPDDIANRFNLHFSMVFTGVDEAINSNEVVIYSNAHTVYIQRPVVANQKAQVAIYNVSGQQVYAGNLENMKLNKIDLNIETGYYVVKVVTENAVATQKVFIK